MIFELMLCGVMWAIALGAVGCVIAVEHGWEPSLQDAKSLATGLGGSGAIGGVVFFVVAYALGQAGRRVARGLFRTTRQLASHWALTETLTVPQARELRRAICRRTENSAYASLPNREPKARTVLGWFRDCWRRATAHLGRRFRLAAPWLALVLIALGYWLTVRLECSGWWAALTLLPLLGLCRKTPEAKRTRYGTDVLRDWVLAGDEEGLSHDLKYHWNCMDAAQNTAIPVLVVACMCAVLDLRQPDVFHTDYLQELLLPSSIVAAAASGLLYKSFVDHAKYLSLAITRCALIHAADENGDP